MATGGELYEYGICIKILKTSEAVLLHRVGHWAARSSERSLISVLTVYIQVRDGREPWGKPQTRVRGQ